MGTIKSLYDRVNSLDIEQVSVNAIEETKDTIEELNQEQMYSGENADGGDIKPFYTPLTQFLKQRKGQPYDRVTLLDTGEFYAGIRVEVVGDTVVTDSTDSKSQKLKAKYGESIFGLNREKKGIYVENSLRPAFSRNIEMVTGLKMR